VTGTIDLPYQDTVIHKVVESLDVKAQGAVARGHTTPGLISLVAPNPFTDRTWLSMNVPHEPSRAPGGGETVAADAVVPVSVSIYDVRGRRIVELFRDQVIEHVVTLAWDGTDDQGKAMPSGIYFARISVGGATEVRKIVRVR
jgi:hypothetical protein